MSPAPRRPLTPALNSLWVSLAGSGVELWMDGDSLRCVGPEGALTPELLASLREHKPELIAVLRAEAQPLTVGQKSLWLLQQIAPTSAAYNLSFSARLKDGVDPARLEPALAQLVARTDALRTRFSSVEGEPVQRCADLERVGLQRFQVAAAELPEAVDRFAERPFSLESEPPVRFGLFLPADGSQPVFALTIHHIIADFWSVQLLVADLEALMHGAGSASPVLPPRRVPRFVDHALHEQQWLQSGQAEADRKYWEQVLSTPVAPLDLPLDGRRPLVQTYAGANHTQRLPPRLTRRLEQLARDAGVTLNMVVMAAFQLFLGRHSGSSAFNLGVPAAGRSAMTEWEQVVGFFANPVVIRADLERNPTFRELLTRVRSTVLGAMEHQHLPFPSLVEHLRPKRDPARPPLFQVMYVWQSSLPPHRLGDTGRVFEPAMSSSRQHGAPYELMLSAVLAAEGIRLQWAFNTALFNLQTVERFAQRFEDLLSSLCDAPDAPVHSVPLVTEREREDLVRTWNRTAAPYAREATVSDLFDLQASRTPDLSALVAGDQDLTFAQLKRRVDRVARALVAHGVQPGDRVGICTPRGVEMVVAMLATLRASAAYVPLDPSYPEARLTGMVEDSGLRLLLRHGDTRVPRVSEAVTTLDLATLGTGDEPDVSSPALPSVSADALAYLIYTSGSTGKPKGVMVTHRNVSNLFTSLDEKLGLPPVEGQRVWLAVTSISFDISVLELLWTLCRGTRVVILEEEDTRSAGAAGSAGPDFSLFFFAADSGPRSSADPYHLLLEAARFADQNGLKALWVPERHFHEFGGLYPNPALAAAALATMTQRLELRAGSVVLPLHDPLRVAEEWAMVDQLSRGRVGISFASGWQPDDFVLAPDRFANRHAVLAEGMQTVRHLWRGGKIRRTNGAGVEIEVGTRPRPVRPELPVWLTAAGNPATFRQAGALGANLLTHLLGQNARELGEKLALYRETRSAAGPGGNVTLMLHTFVGTDSAQVRETIREPFKAYLRSSIDLMKGLTQALGLDPSTHGDVLLEHAFQRYSTTSALFGTPEECLPRVRQMQELGVDEIACLIDFGVPEETVLGSLKHLAELKELSRRAPVRTKVDLAASVAAQVARHGVTHLQCTPSFARMLLEHSGARTALGRLEALLVGGEALPPELAAELTHTGVRALFNMYGPTETTVWSAAQQVEGQSHRVTIGGPFANTQLYVLDEHLQLVPPGVPGELFIGGDGVARGYWARPDLTAERFVPDCFGQDAEGRLYRTGDQVRTLGAGQFEFLGRVDHQVKVRGHRIETGEIEARLAQHPHVASCAVVARPGAGGDGVLIGYVIPRGEVTLAAEGLRRHLLDALPEFMVPSMFVALEAFPMTPNGKVDRKALSERSVQGQTARPAYSAPRNELEGLLQQVWQEVLGLDRVGVQDNFFHIGGHSILEARLQNRLSVTAVGHLELVELFSHPTIESMARFLHERSSSSRTGELGDDRTRRQRAALRQQRVRRSQ
jgi:natural product biosynthesis luciferase-like monooxygenase protein